MRQKRMRSSNVQENIKSTLGKGKTHIYNDLDSTYKPFYYNTLDKVIARFYPQCNLKKLFNNHRIREKLNKSNLITYPMVLKSDEDYNPEEQYNKMKCQSISKNSKFFFQKMNSHNNTRTHLESIQSNIFLKKGKNLNFKDLFLNQGMKLVTSLNKNMYGQKRYQKDKYYSSVRLNPSTSSNTPIEIYGNKKNKLFQIYVHSTKHSTKSLKRKLKKNQFNSLSLIEKPNFNREKLCKNFLDEETDLLMKSTNSQIENINLIQNKREFTINSIAKSKNNKKEIASTEIVSFGNSPILEKNSEYSGYKQSFDLKTDCKGSSQLLSLKNIQNFTLTNKFQLNSNSQPKETLNRLKKTKKSPNSDPNDIIIKPNFFQLFFKL